MSSSVERIPWFVWPFYALWRLVTFALNATGLLVCALLGVIFLAIGISLTLTFVGAPLGIPLAILGFVLLLRVAF